MSFPEFVLLWLLFCPPLNRNHYNFVAQRPVNIMASALWATSYMLLSMDIWLPHPHSLEVTLLPVPHCLLPDCLPVLLSCVDFSFSERSENKISKGRKFPPSVPMSLLTLSLMTLFQGSPQLRDYRDECRLRGLIARNLRPPATLCRPLDSSNPLLGNVILRCVTLFTLHLCNSGKLCCCACLKFLMV